MTFLAYTPPNEGDGLQTVDRDLCWRINPRGFVTPAVIGAICWARNNFKISELQESAILNGLGLEYHALQSGAIVLRPRDSYRVEVFSKGKSRPTGVLQTDFQPNWTNPNLPLIQYDAIEVYGCHQGASGIERFEANEHAPQTQPHFWSVALHLEAGHIETIADFVEEFQAQCFGELMRQILLAAREAADLHSPHLQPQPQPQPQPTPT